MPAQTQNMCGLNHFDRHQRQRHLYGEWKILGTVARLRPSRIARLQKTHFETPQSDRCLLCRSKERLVHPHHRRNYVGKLPTHADYSRRQAVLANSPSGPQERSHQLQRTGQRNSVSLQTPHKPIIPRWDETTRSYRRDKIAPFLARHTSLR